MAYSLAFSVKHCHNMAPTPDSFLSDAGWGTGESNIELGENVHGRMIPCVFL